MEKKEFYVSMPFAGVCTLPVEAESKEAAIEKFYEEYEKLKDGIHDMNAETEWDFYQKMGEGNVRYYTYDEVEVEEA